MINQKEFMQHILGQPDNSITDPETIRQISLLLRNNISDQNTNDITSKIKKGYEFAGLYPDICFGTMNDNKIDVSKLANTDDVQEILERFQKLRAQYKQQSK